MHRMRAFVVTLALLAGAQGAAAQGADPIGSVRVRYIVGDVPAAVEFYAHRLGFKVDGQVGTYFAALSKGGVQLLLSPTTGPGGASQPMPDGRKPAPGGWNRLVLTTSDIQGDVARLRKEGVHFRNGIVAGPGGREILLEDPSGNSVELFQPG